jgi:hypothetical protein
MMKEMNTLVVALVLVCTGHVAFATVPELGETIYLEWGSSDWDPRVPITSPISTTWHEIYPIYSQDWHLASWKDNGDGHLSPCDHIDMDFGGVGGSPTVWFHVEDVTITLWLTEKIGGEPIGPESAIELIDGYPIIDATMSNPISTMWHQIYPPAQFSHMWHLTSWEDNYDGVLSYSDQIDMEGPTGLLWFHIDRVTTDLIVTAIPEPATVLLLGLGSLALLRKREGWSS